MDEIAGAGGRTALCESKHNCAAESNNYRPHTTWQPLKSCLPGRERSAEVLLTFQNKMRNNKLLIRLTLNSWNK